jgi:hypothetical protein
MTRLPRSPGSTLVLRLYQETVYDFILLLMPPCGPHLTPLATGSLKRSLLVFATPGGLTGDDLSRLFFTCTNTSQAATCTCNTQPRICPHNVVNHSSHKEATIHRSLNHTCSSVSTSPAQSVLAAPHQAGGSMTFAGEPLRTQGFRRTLYNFVHSRITSQGWHNLALTQL